MIKTAIIISIYGFCIFSLNAQQIDKIKKNKNVFFILFDAKYEYMRKFDLSRNKKDTTFNYVYSFYNKKENKIEEYDFSFNYSKYWTFDDAHNDINERMVFKLNKSFLRKNKDIIITREFIESIGEDALIELLAGGFNHVFLIDKGEIKKNKILVREVRFNYTADE